MPSLMEVDDENAGVPDPNGGASPFGNGRHVLDQNEGDVTLVIPDGGQALMEEAWNGCDDGGDPCYMLSRDEPVHHDPNWSPEEQEVLEWALEECAYVKDNACRYAAISDKLPNKRLLDVAARCKWMECKAKKPAISVDFPKHHEICCHAMNYVEENIQILHQLIPSNKPLKMEEYKHLISSFCGNLRLINGLFRCIDTDVLYKTNTRMQPVPSKLDGKTLSAMLKKLYYSS